MKMTIAIVGIDITKVPALQNSNLGEDFVKNNIAYAVICQSQEEVKQKGILGKYIMGFVKDPKEPITPQVFKTNGAFRKLVFDLAANSEDGKLKEALGKSPNKTVAMVDQRIKDVNEKIPPEEIIGIYRLKEDGIVSFEGNPNYAIVSTLGLAKFTPEIRKQLVSAE